MSSNIEIFVLYSKPLHVVNTEVSLDGVMFQQFTDINLSEYPPLLGSKSTQVSLGTHKIRVMDRNFQKAKEFKVQIGEPNYFSIIISEKNITLTKLKKPPSYK